MKDEPFDPEKHMGSVSGKRYLEVKWRLVWFRQIHPDGSIETDLVQATGDSAIFKARVSWPTETGIAVCTGWGSETSSDFGDFLEKAETKAIGRALSAAGYGTQFTPDHDFGAAQQRVVDSPVDIRSERAPRPNAPAMRQDARPTEKQIKYLHKLASDAGLSHDGLSALCEERYGGGVGDLSKQQASELIEAFQAGAWGQNVDRETGEILPPEPHEGFVPEPRDEILASLQEIDDRRDLPAMKRRIRELRLDNDDEVIVAYREAFERLQQPALAGA